MHNFNVVNKGEYERKQTSENVKVSRFIIVRKRQKRYLVLELENVRDEVLTSLTLQIDQFGGKDNYLQTKNVKVEKLKNGKGKFILKEKIEIHRACADFFVKVMFAEYGAYQFCLEEQGTFGIYNKIVMPKKADEKEVKKTVGKSGVAKATRKFSAPVFVRIFSIFILAVVLAVSAWQVLYFKNTEREFVLSGVAYEFANESRDNSAPIIITGINGYSDTLVINDTIEGHPVIGIKEDTFKDNLQIKHLTINGNVLGNGYIFSNCTNLKSLTLNNVKEIPVGAFDGCINLTSVKIHNTEKINYKAFANCESLQKLVITSDKKECVLQIDQNVFNTQQVLAELTVDQFIDFSQRKDVFSGLGGAIKLSLKNYNYEPYEKDADSNNSGIARLFDSESPLIEDLTIENTDKIPAYFASGVELFLSSVTVENLGSSVLGAGAFEDCAGLTEIDVSLPFTEIGTRAFSGTAISKIDASAVSKMGESAFYNCYALTEFDLSKNNVLTEIPNSAFRGATSLNKFFVSKEISKIGEYAFYQSGLTEVEFEKDIALKCINAYTFADCAKLKQITIPASVEEIGEKAFANNEGLTSFEVPDSVEYIGLGILQNSTNVEQLKIPFLGYSLINEGTLGYVFGESSYWYQTNSIPTKLTKVTITLDNDLGEGAFYDCGNLKEVSLPETLSEISYYAFENCYNIREITIPRNVAFVASSAFRNCYRLYEITNLSSQYITRGDSNAKYALAVYNEGDQPLPSATINGYKFLKASEGWYVVDLPSSGEDYYFPLSVYGEMYTIPTRFFHKTNGNKVEISGAIKKIGDYAFSNSGLNEIKISTYIQSWGNELFSYNSELTKVDLSSSNLQSVSDRMFIEDSRLKTVVLPSSVLTIDDYGFAYCSNLKDINLPSRLTSIREYAFYNCFNLKTLTLPATLLTIEDSAFANCLNLENLLIPSSVQSIGGGILRGCNKINKLTVPFIGRTIEENRYISYFFSDYNDYYYNTYAQVNTVEITNAMSITNRCFAGNNYITEIIINDDVLRIGDYAFESCGSLQTVVMPSKLQILGTSAFAYCSNLKSISLPYRISEIGASTFESCRSLQTVTMPSNLQTIGNYAFRYCEKLESINLPYGVIDIGYYAFAYCDSIQELTLPTSVEWIDDYAFAYCEGLKSITLPYNVSTIGGYAFAYCTNLGCVVINNVSASASVASTAFSGSNRIHQVYNLTSRSIERFTSAFGGVAKNAIVVDSSSNAEKFKETTVDGIKIKYRDGICAIVGYESYNSTVKINQIKIDGKTYNNAYIAAYAFSNSNVSNIVIGSCVTEIYPNAFSYMSRVTFTNCSAIIYQNAFTGYISTLIYDNKLTNVDEYAFYNIYDVCYYGTASEWLSMQYYVPYELRPDYYYSECIHDISSGLWNYDEYGNVNVYSLTELSTRIVKEPTCEEMGIGENYCEKCDYTERYSISSTGHNYGNGYVCTRCGEVRDVTISASTYASIAKEFFTEKNDVQPFAIYDYDVYYRGIQSTNTAVGSSSTLTYTIKRKVTLTFSAEFSSASIGELIVNLNGQQVVATGTTLSNKSIDLKAGDVLTFTFKRNNRNADECYVRIKGIKIS